MHFLNLLWLPLQEHIHQVAAGSSPTWTAALDKHHQALTAEMQGIVPSPDEVLDFSDWVQYICKAIKRHLDVDIPPRARHPNPGIGGAAFAGDDPSHGYARSQVLCVPAHGRSGNGPPDQPGRPGASR